MENILYDVVIIGAGPGGIYAAYELTSQNPGLKIAVLEKGNPLEKRRCPIDGDKIPACIHCSSCSIMNGFGGAGAFSDGKYNITNEFGGTLYQYVGEKQAIDLMEYVDEINCRMGGDQTRLYASEDPAIARKCLQNGLHLLNAKVRHLGTDINYVVLENLYAHLKDKVDFFFNMAARTVQKQEAEAAGIAHMSELPVFVIETENRQHEPGVVLGASASFPPAAADRTGWNQFAPRSTFPPLPAGSISVSGWKFLSKRFLK